MVSGEPSNKKAKLDVELENEMNDKESVNGKGYIDVEGKVLTLDRIIQNIEKTKEEMHKKLYPKYRLKAKKLVKKARKFTIDLNLNMNVTNESNYFGEHDINIIIVMVE